VLSRLRVPDDSTEQAAKTTFRTPPFRPAACLTTPLQRSHTMIAGIMQCPGQANRCPTLAILSYAILWHHHAKRQMSGQSPEKDDRHDQAGCAAEPDDQPDACSPAARAAERSRDSERSCRPPRRQAAASIAHAATSVAGL